MTYVVTHVLAAIILVELFREYFIKDNRKFPRYYILVAAIGGILPDFDIGIYYVLYFFGFSFDQIHRTFMHTIFVPLILALIGFVIYEIGIKNAEIRKRHMKLSIIFFILAIGSVVHLILDVAVAGSIRPFHPILTTSIGINLVNIIPEGLRFQFLGVLDAILLVAWILWMEFKLKITDYF